MFVLSDAKKVSKRDDVVLLVPETTGVDAAVQEKKNSSVKK